MSHFVTFKTKKIYALLIHFGVFEGSASLEMKRVTTYPVWLYMTKGQTILIIQTISFFSILLLSIFRQYEFISEYLIKAEKHLATDGLLRKVVVQSVNSLLSNLFAWWRGIAFCKVYVYWLRSIIVLKEMLILNDEKLTLGTEVQSCFLSYANYPQEELLKTEY